VYPPSGDLSEIRGEEEPADLDAISNNMRLKETSLRSYPYGTLFTDYEPGLAPRQFIIPRPSLGIYTIDQPLIDILLYLYTRHKPSID
jgi:hypothetical protein